MVVSTYSSDLEAYFLDEFLQFKDILSSESDRSVTNISTLLRSKDGILTTAFPNISILIRIFLKIPITNCEGERSLSTLSRVKNHLRSTMRQTRLNSLSLLCRLLNLASYNPLTKTVGYHWNSHSLLYFMCLQFCLCFKLIVFLSLFPYILYMI